MIYIILFFVSLLLTYVVREYAKLKSILDIPNHRSSHNLPTPSLGGVAIIATFYFGLFFLKESIPNELFYALLPGIFIAVLGYVDDRKAISSKIRLLVQSIVIMIALCLLGGVEEISLVHVIIEGWWLNIAAFVFMLWLINLYNFLDGIDGYAATQAIFVGVSIYALYGTVLGLLIAVSSFGFLIFNWQKASIFMGDVGSTTLGYIFAIMVLYDGSTGNIYVWSVLLSLFWFDATLTLIRRYRNGEPVIQAHKKHAYQRLVQSGWSHQKVVTVAMVVNLLFLSALLLTENAIIVFIVNIIFLYGVVRWIDQKKCF